MPPFSYSNRSGDRISPQIDTDRDPAASRLMIQPYYSDYGVGEAEADAFAEDALAGDALVEAALAVDAPAEELLAADALAADVLAADVLAGEALAGETPSGPALMVRTTGALGLASVPAEGSVPVTVPYFSGPLPDRMAATL